MGLLYSNDITELVEDLHDQPSAASDDTQPTQNISLSMTSLDNLAQDYDSPRAQIDLGAKATVTNAMSLLWDIQHLTNEFPSPVKMYGATNKNLLITPTAVGKLRIPAMTQEGYIDVRCYYSSHFSSTLLSEADLLHATGKPNDYSGQTTDKFFHGVEGQVHINKA